MKNLHEKNPRMNKNNFYSLSDFVDVIGAVNQVIEESTGGELLVLSLRAHAERGDAIECANQLSNGLTLKAEQIGRRKFSWESW